MNKLRIKELASFIEKEDKVIDIGCDHAYLPIYLVKEKLCKSIIASDINENALQNAQKNIEKEHLERKIPILLSDGLEKVDQKKINTIVIAGMGTSTILQILKKVDQDRIKKMIVQSNHDLYTLRKEMQKMGYYLQKETVIYEKGHFYTIGFYTQEKKPLKKREIYFGHFNQKNQEYYHYLEQEYKKINKKIKWRHFKEKIKLLYKIHLLKKYL